jgi:hypothetical protein
MNRKLLITSAAAIGCLGVGGTAVAAFASSPSVTPISIGQQADAEDSTTDSDSARSDRLAEVLAPLVADGTLNQAQADSVIAALEAARPDRGDHGGPGAMGGRHGRGDGAKLEAAATVLGLTAEELMTEVRNGSTLAEVAAEQGVETQAVIDALVADATTRINEGVADGRLTQEQADARLAGITEKITDLVNNGRPEGGPGHRGGHRGDDDAQTPTTEGS